MKLLIGTLLLFMGLNSNAHSMDCKEQYSTVFRLAAENTWYSKNEVANRANIALAFGKLGQGSGPSRLTKQNFLSSLIQSSMNDLNGLSRDQVTLQNLLKNSAKCFPGLSQDEILNTYEMLTK